MTAETPAEDLHATLEQRLVSLGVEAGAATARQTLRGPPALAEDAIVVLRAIEDGAEPPLAIHETLGEGGMGIVQLGTQRSLGRDVALKTLRPERRTQEAVARLVREAVVTGSLEHPNVVPVYDLALAREDVPVLVMKRIEGRTWTACMRDAAATTALTGSSDLLEWNLQTLMSVCQAVHFAHARGVVHRDLKPDNVMVGRFGEVYVLDWGIAVRAQSPRATDPDSNVIVGTPVYMAPEMLGGGPVSERTDVYLLGAILFEILVGRAPHDKGGTTREIVASILTSPPELPPGTPEELAALVRACMRRDIAERPESAEVVRRAIAEFLRHRGGAAIAAKACERHGALDRALAADPVDDQDVQRLSGEVAFGYRAALEAWPDNEQARAGLARVTRALVRHDLAKGQPKAARTRLADLETPDDALRAEVDRAIARAEEQERRDAALRREMDPQTGRRGRVVLPLLLGGLWTLQPLLQQMGLFGPETHLAGALSAVVTIGFWAVFAVALRRHILRSRLNRQLAAVALLVLVVQVLAYASAGLLGLPPQTTQTQLLFVWFVIASVLGVTVDARLLVPAAAFLTAFWVGAEAPRLRLLAEAAANAALVATALVAWRARPPRDL